jgi:hypothetical protein
MNTTTENTNTELDEWGYELVFGSRGELIEYNAAGLDLSSFSENEYGIEIATNREGVEVEVDENGYTTDFDDEEYGYYARARESKRILEEAQRNFPKDWIEPSLWLGSYEEWIIENQSYDEMIEKVVEALKEAGNSEGVIDAFLEAIPPPGDDYPSEVAAYYDFYQVTSLYAG